MDSVKADVFQALRERGIPFEAMEHAPVHTIEDCAPIGEALFAVIPKNLFLTPRNQSAFYLLLVSPDANFRTADISKQIGSSRLSFASAEKLAQFMRTQPGAISPMGLLFDGGRQIQLLVDRALLSVAHLAFHPCVNTATLAMSNADFFEKYLPGAGYAPIFVDIHPEA